jgi:hypothetical protein
LIISIDAEKALSKIQHHFMIKGGKAGIEGMYLNIIKAVYGKLIANNILFIIIHLFTCAYIAWAISSTYSPLPPSVPPNLPRFQAEPVLPLSLILLKRKHKQ